jgi:hypothetical protein
MKEQNFKQHSMYLKTILDLIQIWKEPQYKSQLMAPVVRELRHKVLWHHYEKGIETYGNRILLIDRTFHLHKTVTSPSHTTFTCFPGTMLQSTGNDIRETLL